MLTSDHLSSLCRPAWNTSVVKLAPTLGIVFLVSRLLSVKFCHASCLSVLLYLSVVFDAEAFHVKVGLRQMSVLSALIFVIVMEVISKELLYADNSIFLTNNEVEQHEKIAKLKAGGLKMNTVKIKVMFSCSATL